MDGKKIVIGLDLNSDTTQIAVKRGQAEPEVICLTPGGDEPEIPTCLCLRDDTRDWLFGEEAIRCRKRNGGLFIDDLLKKAEQNEEVMLFADVAAKGSELLGRFVRKIMTVLRQRYMQDTIERVVITMKEPSEAVYRAVTEALLYMGIEEAAVRIQSHVQSFMYYTVSQKRELWANDVGLFDYDRDGLKYYQLTTSRRFSPIAVSVQSTDYSEMLDYSMSSTMSEGELSYCFKTAADKAINRQIISTIFATGPVFEENTWCDGVLRGLCVGTARRVFKGNNLFVKGAAYAASAEEAEWGEEFLFLSEDMIRSTVSIRMFRDNRISDYPLVEAGTRWEDAKAKTVGILDDTKEIHFTLFHAMRKDTKYVVMTLRDLHQRENKTTRISIGVSFVDRDTLVITVKDLGFGRFYENTYRVWEKVVPL